jgi:hypothetical protein
MESTAHEEDTDPWSEARPVKASEAMRSPETRASGSDASAQGGAVQTGGEQGARHPPI